MKTTLKSPSFKSTSRRAARILGGPIAALLAAAFLAPQSAKATTYYWDQNDIAAGFGTAGGTWDGIGSSTWNTTADGTTGPIVSTTTTTSDTINFGNGATGLGAGTITVGTVSSGNITFASGDGAIVLSSGTITLAAAATITVSNATDTISSVLAGAATSLTTNGTGTLILSGANTYTGTTTITAGTLVAQNTAALGAASAPLSLGGGTLDIQSTPSFNAYNTTVTANSTISSDLASSGAGINYTFGTLSIGAQTLTITQGANATGTTAGVTFGNTTLTGNAIFSPAANTTLTLGKLSGASTVTMAGAGTLTLSSTLSAATGLTINSGGTVNMLTNNSVSSIPLVVNGTLNFNNGQIFGVLTGSGTINENTNYLYTNSGSSGTFSGSINGTGGYVKQGTGTETLSGANTYTGVTQIQSGALALGNAAALGGNNPGVNGTSVITMSTGATLRTPLTNGAAIVYAPITTSGNVTINAPTTNTGTQTWNEFILKGAIGGTGNVTFSNIVNANTILTVTLNAQSNYSGTTTLDNTAGSAGQLFIKLGVDNALPTTTVLNILGQAGAGTGRGIGLDLFGHNQTLAGLTNTAYSTRQQRIVNPDVSAAATLTINGSTNTAFSGSLGSSSTSAYELTTGNIPGVTNGNNFGLTKSGTGTFTLSGTNSYNGATNISAGRIQIATTASALSPNTAVTVTGTGQLYINAAGTYANNFNISGLGFGESDTQSNFDGTIRADGTNTLSGTITLSGNSRIATYGTAGNDTISGKITGGFGIDFYGMNSAGNAAQTFVLSNTANDYTGNTTIYNSNYNSATNSGSTTTLKLGASNVIPNGASAGNLVFAINGTNPGNTETLDLASFSETINGVTVNAGANAKITNSVAGSSVLTIGDNNTTSSFGGTITNTTGTLAITKIGSGMLTLTGSNTYTGATTISAGTLKISGGSSLGSGTYAGAITDNGTLQYSSSAAQTFSGNISGSGALTKDTAASVLTVSGSNNLTGLTLVTAGTLQLDFTTNNNSKIGTGMLTLGGGTLDLKGGSFTQIAASTTLTAGTASSVTSSTPGSVLQMGTITAGTGATVNFGAAGIATTNNSNDATGILGTWATVGGSDWAINSTGLANGPITAYTGYTPVQRLTPGSISDGSTTNVQIVEGSGSTGSITLVPGITPHLTTINTLNQSTVGGTSAALIDPAGGTFATNAILVGTGAGGLTIGATAGDGSSLMTATPGGNLAIINNSLNASTINAVIADNTSASSLTLSGTGTVTLAGANTYTGGTTVAAGVLQIGGVGSLESGTYPGNIAITGGTFQYSSSAAQTLSGVVSGAGALIKDTNSGSTLTLSGANTYTGATTVSAGTLSLTGSLAGGTAITVSGSAVLSEGATGAISGAASLSDTSSGTSTLAGANTYIGATTVSAGTLSLTGSLAGGTAITVSGSAVLSEGSMGAISGATSLSHTSSGTSTLAGTNTYTGATAVSAGTLSLTGSLAGGTAITVSGSAVLSEGATGAISGAASLSDTSSGTSTLAGTNTYTGNTTVAGGTLNITGTLTGNVGSSTLALGTTATNTVVNVSGNMSLNAITGANIANSNAVYNQTAGTVNVTLAGVGSAGSYVANIGYGYFNLTGGTFNSNGSFNIGANNASSVGVAYVGGTGILNWSGTGNQTVGYASPASLTVGPGGSVSRGATTATTWLATNSGSSAILNIAGGSLDLGTAGLVRVNNTASGGTSVTFNLAAGTLTMGIPLATNGSNSGNLYANYAGGTLKASAALASPMNVLTSVSTIFGAIDNSAAVGNTSQNFTGGLTVDTNGNAVTYGNALLGATGNGVTQTNMTLTGGSGYIGAPLVQFTGGTLAANGTPAAGYAVINASTGAVTGIVITSPGEYAVDPTAVTLTGGGGTGASVALSALSANAADKGLTKIGAGTLTLSAFNTYSGTTSINGGILSISASGNLGNASATNTISINGGTLQDTGAGVVLATNQAVTVGASGGTVDVAPSADLTISGTISGTGNLLTKTGNGTLNINGAVSDGTTLKTNGGTTNVNAVIGTGTAVVDANATTNFTTSQTLGGLNIGSVMLAGLGEAPSFSGGVAVGSVVPEPGSISLLLVGALGLASLRRRRV